MRRLLALCSLLLSAVMYGQAQEELSLQDESLLQAESKGISAAGSFRAAVRKVVPEYDFANLGSNRIIFQGDSTAFDIVFSKLDSLRSGDSCNLRIMYIGGSHVQGGTLTRQLRNDLTSLGDSLDGGRGLVFPYWAAHTNTPTSFITRCGGSWEATKNTDKNPGKRLGLTGMAISTSDSSAFVRIVTFPRKPDSGDRPYYFNKVKILGYSSGGDRHPVILLDNGDTLTCTQNLGVAAAVTDSCLLAPRDQAERKDSTHSDSCFVFNLPARADSLTILTAGTTGEFTLTGIFLDNSKSGITVSEIGVNGAALTSYAKCQDLVRDLRMVNPDLVIFGIGINDASGPNFTEDLFVNRYHSLIDKVLSVNPDCALLFATNNDSYRRTRRRGYYVNSNGPVAEGAFLRLGKEYNAGVWDLFDIMGGLGSMRKWESAGLAKKDKIHFTDEGYSLLGNLLFNALMDKYSDHLQKSAWRDGGTAGADAEWK